MPYLNLSQVNWIGCNQAIWYLHQIYTETLMYNSIQGDIQAIWGNCVGFEKVNSASSFIEYIKKCQLTTTFFFNGSTDDSLEEQLKSLFLKQEFSKFVFAHQRVPPAKLLLDFKEFVSYAQPQVLAFPTWRAGMCSLDGICMNKRIENKLSSSVLNNS